MRCFFRAFIPQTAKYSTIWSLDKVSAHREACHVLTASASAVSVFRPEAHSEIVGWIHFRSLNGLGEFRRETLDLPHPALEGSKPQ